jgi:hypothetical protein
LSQSDASKIRDVLAKVKPCQKPLVRYAFPDNGHMVMFFAVGPNQLAHIFGEGNSYYLTVDNTAIVPPNDAEDIDSEKAIHEGVQWDIDHTPCTSPSR